MIIFFTFEIVIFEIEYFILSAVRVKYTFCLPKFSETSRMTVHKFFYIKACIMLVHDLPSLSADNSRILSSDSRD